MDYDSFWVEIDEPYSGIGDGRIIDLPFIAVGDWHAVSGRLQPSCIEQAQECLREIGQACAVFEQHTQQIREFVHEGIATTLEMRPGSSKDEIFSQNDDANNNLAFTFLDRVGYSAHFNLGINVSRTTLKHLLSKYLNVDVSYTGEFEMRVIRDPYARVVSSLGRSRERNSGDGK